MPVGGRSRRQASWRSPFQYFVNAVFSEPFEFLKPFWVYVQQRRNVRMPWSADCMRSADALNGRPFLLMPTRNPWDGVGCPFRQHDAVRGAVCNENGVFRRIVSDPSEGGGVVALMALVVGTARSRFTAAER